MRFLYPSIIKAFKKVCRAQCKVNLPTNEELNFAIACVLGGTTASLRCKGSLNVDLRKIATNLIPFPKLHFLYSSFIPLSMPVKQQTLDDALNDTEDVTKLLFSFFLIFLFKADTPFFLWQKVFFSNFPKKCRNFFSNEFSSKKF